MKNPGIPPAGLLPGVREGALCPVVAVVLRTSQNLQDQDWVKLPPVTKNKEGILKEAVEIETEEASREGHLEAEHSEVVRVVERVHLGRARLFLSSPWHFWGLARGVESGWWACWGLFS